MNIKGTTIFITGGSRGIGLAIALRLAREGANVAIAAKTVTPHPVLKGTIHTAVEAIQAAGGQGLAIQMDVRFDEQVSAAINLCAETFGGIDILINNASAIQLTSVSQTPMKRYDLMHDVNVRGTYLSSMQALPYLIKSEHAHILNLSPPLNMNPMWFGNHLAYTMSKYGMSMCVLGMSEEFKDHNIAVNALWPKTLIATAAVQNVLGGDAIIQHCRKPEIVADAAYEILKMRENKPNGSFFIDEEVLRQKGVVDFDKYAVNSNVEPYTDIFLDQ